MTDATVERIRHDRIAISLQVGDVRASLVAPVDSEEGSISSACHKLESAAVREIQAIADVEEDVPDDVDVRSSGSKYEDLLDGSRLRSAAEGS